MVVYPNIAFVMAMLTTLTLPILFPDTSFMLWRDFVGLPSRLRARRQARMSRELNDRLKKYWVIDMRKLR
jgi:hypothetical protein